MTDEALQQHLTERCVYWADRLRLRDWQVTVRLVDRREMGNDTNLGDTTFNRRHRIAALRLLRSEDIDPAQLVQQDYEFTLVHELIHVHLVDWPIAARDGEDILESIPMEVAINSLAGALVGLDQGCKTPELTEREDEYCSGCDCTHCAAETMRRIRMEVEGDEG